MTLKLVRWDQASARRLSTASLGIANLVDKARLLSMCRVIPGNVDGEMFRRIPHIKQHDQSDCGAAALAIVLRHYGRHVAVARIRELAGTDSVGTNLLGLIDGANALGIKATGAKGSFEALAAARLPAIVHVVNADGLGHFVVLFRIRKGHVVVSDPGSAVLRIEREEFCRQWSGYVLLCEPSDPTRGLAAGGPNSSAIRHPVARLLALLRAHTGILAESLVCALLMTLLGISTSLFVQHLVDSVLTEADSGLLNALGIGMLVIVLFRTLFGVLRGYLLAHMGRRIDLALTSEYMSHVVRLPMRFFETRRIGEIISRSNDTQKIREAISGTAITIVLDGLMLVISGTILWCYDARLAAVTTAFVPVLLLAVLSHHSSARRRAREAMEGAARYSAHAIEDISGVSTIKALGIESSRGAARDSRLLDVVESVFSLRALGISMNAFSTLTTGAAGIVVLWYGGHRVIDGALSIGQLMFFYTMLGHLLGPLERLASVNLQIQDALVAADRLFEVTDLEPEALSESSKINFRKFDNAIRFEQVRFRYGCREEVLRGVDLAIPAGATVGIVGESGSGKSTLLKLLMGFYQADKGRLTIDEVDARDFRPDSIRNGMAMVSQESFVFDGTLRENIALSCHDASFDKVISAATAAGLDEYINGLPERYDTVIGERGVNLSGGQRQRLAIARALMSDAPILLLDEATSHLDTATELTIQRNLASAVEAKTVVVIAHRLSTIREADLIYVMHEGEVAESGNHRSLLAANGRYAALWRAQTGESDRQGPRLLPNDASVLDVGWRGSASSLCPLESSSVHASVAAT